MAHALSIVSLAFAAASFPFFASVSSSSCSSHLRVVLDGSIHDSTFNLPPLPSRRRLSFDPLAACPSPSQSHSISPRLSLAGNATPSHFSAPSRFHFRLATRLGSFYPNSPSSTALHLTATTNSIAASSLSSGRLAIQLQASESRLLDSIAPVCCRITVIRPYRIPYRTASDG